MDWRPQHAPDLSRDIIVFDGDCVLCSRWARFVDRRDKATRFGFVMIQSEYGRALAARFDVDADAPATNIVAIDGIVLFKFDAALGVLRALPGYKWVRIFGIFPRALRNWLYDRIARNRYRLFGKRAMCALDDPGLKARLLERS